MFTPHTASSLECSASLGRHDVVWSGLFSMEDPAVHIWLLLDWTKSISFQNGNPVSHTVTLPLCECGKRIPMATTSLRHKHVIFGHWLKQLMLSLGRHSSCSTKWLCCMANYLNINQNIRCTVLDSILKPVIKIILPTSWLERRSSLGVPEDDTILSLCPVNSLCVCLTDKGIQ